MRNLLSIIIIIQLFILSNSANSQIAECEASINNHASISVDTWQGKVNVYPSTRNSPEHPENNCYFIEPSFYLKSKDGIQPYVNIPYEGLFFVDVTLIISFPPANVIYRELQKTNPKINPQRISNFPLGTITISHPRDFFETIEIKSNSINPVYQNEIPLALKFKMNDTRQLNQFANKIKLGQEIFAISFNYREAEIKKRYMEIKGKQILNTKSYKSYIQKSKNKKVLASQVYDFSNDVLEEIHVSQWDEFLSNDENEFNKILTDFSSQLLQNHQRNFLNVKDIKEMVSSFKINMNSDHFQPEFISHFVQDVKNKKETELKEYFKSIYRDYKKNLRNSEVGGGGGFSLLKLFKINGDYNKKLEEMSETEFLNMCEKENYFREQIDKSFRIEWDGKQIKRLDIEVFEPMEFNEILRLDKSLHSSKVVFRTGWSTVHLSTKKILIN